MTQRIKNNDLYWDHDDECTAQNPCSRCTEEAEKDLYAYGVDVEVEDEDPDGGTWRTFRRIK